MFAALGWSDCLAIGAFAISLASVVFTARADRRGGRAERREVEATDAARRAELVVESLGPSSAGDGRFLDKFAVRNVGQATARDLVAWLENEEGERVSGFSRKLSLMPGDGSTPPLVVSTHVPDSDQLALVLKWVDGVGPHEESSGIRPIRI
jgi:hypothetical protein